MLMLTDHWYGPRMIALSGGWGESAGFNFSIALKVPIHTIVVSGCNSLQSYNGISHSSLLIEFGGFTSRHPGNGQV